MTLDYILNAAVNSMIHGHHTPHCYSAWVKGEGYVNKGDNTVARHDRADYLRQLERTAKSEVENMGFASEYAEPGYEQPKRGVLLANWNNLPSELDSILERAGYAIEWSDEWSTCDNCGKAIRTQPDGYSWKPSYAIVDDSSILCTECHAETEDSE